jgi:hypothetical protein
LRFAQQRGLSEGFDGAVKEIGRSFQFMSAVSAHLEEKTRAAGCLVWIHDCICTDKPEFRWRYETPASLSTAAWRELIDQSEVTRDE